MKGNPIESNALAFVVVSRMLVFALFQILGAPLAFIVSRLPDSPQPSFPRLVKARDWLTSHLEARSPEWVEHHGKGMIKLKTTRGSERLDAIVAWIPDRVFGLWRRFGVVVMTVFLVVWGVAFLAYVGFVLRTLGRVGSYVADTATAWLTTFDWRSLFEPQPTPNPPDLAELASEVVAAIPDLAVGLAVLAISVAVAVAVFTVLVWIVMLPLLPGLVLHEFGHYAAARKAGASVDEYGLLLYGPVLAGAYVEPGDDAEELDTADSFAVWAGGIANTMLWGLCLVGVGVGLGASVPDVMVGFQTGGFGVLVAQGLPAAIALIGVFEMANGFLNAIPVGPVDGGGFIREAEQDWFDIEDLAESPLSVVTNR